MAALEDANLLIGDELQEFIRPVTEGGHTSIPRATDILNQSIQAYREDVMSGRELTDGDTQLMNILTTPTPAALMHTLDESLFVNGLTLPSGDDMATPEARIRSILATGYDAMKENKIPTPDLDRYSRASILMTTDDLDINQALEQVSNDLPYGVESDYGQYISTSVIDMYPPVNPMEMVDPLTWFKPGMDGQCYGYGHENHPNTPLRLFDEADFRAPTLGAQGDLQLAVLGGAGATLGASIDLENHEISFEGKLGICEGTRADASVMIYAEPSRADGTFARLGTATVAEADMEIRTPLAGLGVGVKSEVGAELRTDTGLGLINNVDPRFVSHLGPLNTDDNGRISIGLGAKTGASICQEGMASVTISAADVLPEFLYTDPNRSVLDDYVPPAVNENDSEFDNAL